jgi:hypothetical protein
MKNSWIRKLMFLAVTGVVAIPLLSACKDGPAEKPAEKLDDAAEHARDKADDLGNKVEDATHH